jgi:hypothetical protein
MAGQVGMVASGTQSRNPLATTLFWKVDVAAVVYTTTSLPLNSFPVMLESLDGAKPA